MFDISVDPVPCRNFLVKFDRKAKRLARVTSAIDVPHIARPDMSHLIRLKICKVLSKKNVGATPPGAALGRISR